MTKKQEKYIIDIQDLTVKVKNKYGRCFSILKNIYINIKEGEIFAFIGPNGAGKSTTIRSILGLQKQTNGEIKLFGNNKLEKIKYKIGYSPDEAIFYEYLTAVEHLILFSKLSSTEQNKTKLYQKSTKILNKVGLEHHKDLYIKDYSKGMKQRLGLAISLVNDPELLIWDEPMNGLDPIGRKQIKELIKALQSQGKTIFFSTHILTDVEELANKFALIHKGKILCQKTTNTISGSLEDFFIQQISK